MDPSALQQVLLNRALDLVLKLIAEDRPCSAPEHSTSKSRKTIMPPMTIEEAIETTKIHSICALLNDNNSFCTPGPSALPIIRFPTWACFGARRIRAPMK